MASFTVEQEFPVGLDRLWTAVGRADYVREKYRALGATEVRLRRFTATAGRIDVDLERDLPVALPLPPGAGAPGASLRTLRHRSTWRRDAPDHARVDIEITPLGLPVDARGDGALHQTAPDRCRLELHWRTVAGESLGLLRGLAAAIFARRVREALAEDHAFTLAWLSRAKARPAGRG